LIDEATIYNEIGEESYFNPVTRKLLKVRNLIIGDLCKHVNSVLDAGCGYGFLYEDVFMNSNIDYFGVDVSRNRIKYCKSKWPADKFELKNIYEIDELCKKFDKTILQEVLEHLSDPKKAIKKILKITKFEIVITVPYKEKVQFEVCIHCGKKTPRSGHIWYCDEKGMVNIITNKKIKWSELFENRPYEIFYIWDPPYRLLS